MRRCDKRLLDAAVFSSVVVAVLAVVQRTVEIAVLAVVGLERRQHCP